jgi:hypothetical protein
MTQDTIVGVFLIVVGTPLMIWEIRTFVRGEQGFLGYDVSGLVLGIGFIIWGITLLV